LTVEWDGRHTYEWGAVLFFIACVCFSLAHASADLGYDIDEILYRV